VANFDKNFDFWIKCAKNKDVNNPHFSRNIEREKISSEVALVNYGHFLTPKLVHGYFQAFLMYALSIKFSFVCYFPQSPA
jgi:hypothetical protein